MNRLLVSTSSIWLAFSVFACSSSGGNTGPANSTGGSSSATSTSKGGQSGTTTTNSSGPVGGSSASSTTSGPTGSGGSTATSGNTGAGGSTATSGNTGAGGSTGAGGNTAGKGGSTGAGGNTAGKGGNTGAGGSSSSNTSTSSSSGGADAKGGGGGAGPKGGSSSVGGASAAVGGSSSSSTATPGGSSGVTVQLDKEHQKIQGFGINDTWAEGALPAKLFSTTDADGLGLSILRVGMSDTGADYSTNIAGDITMAKAAGAKIIGSCWSPPANYKGQSTVNDGGHLQASYYDQWATTIVNWAKKNGLYAMSIGNEPDFASCGMNEPCNGNYPTTLFTAKEMVAWVKVAGKKLQDAGIKVIAPEASEWIHNWSNISGTGSEPSNKNSSDPLKCGCFGNVIDAATEAKCSATCTSGGGYDYGHWLAKDAEAWAAFDIMGVHEYDTQHAEVWPADVTDGKVTKEIWQTEMSGVKWWPEQGTISGTNVTGTTTIENGVAVAGWIHSALVVGEASAWLYWWYKPLGTDDNEGLLVKSGGVAKRYYTLGNYSRFVRPGQTMVEVTGNSNANLLISAFKGTEGVVVVAINKSTTAVTVPITIAGGTAPAKCTPNVTSSADNLKAGTAVSVTDGAFSAALGATSVTTFVCK